MFSDCCPGPYHRRSRRNRLLISVAIVVLLLQQLAWIIHVWFDDGSSLHEMESSESSIRQLSLSNPRTFRGRIFYCGYKVPLAEYMFPDYEYMGDSLWELPNWRETNETVEIPDHKKDILVVGMAGGNCNRNGDERRSFAGKILYINGEPEGDAVSQAWYEYAASEEVYQIGPYGAETKPWHPQLNSFFHNHSLQVYHTAFHFMGTIYLPTHHNHNADYTKISEKEDSSGDDKAQQTTEKSSSSASALFDPWKQLVEGNGRSSASGPEPPRIPAVVYVSRNCVEYRQKTAILLAKEFQDLATSGVSIEEGSKKNDPSERQQQPKPKRQRRRRRLGDSQIGSDRVESFLHYGGQCRVEGGIPVPSTVLEGWENSDRSQFQSNYETIYTRYKYCLVVENTVKEGYVTEKLMHALLGGCLPIYYGSKVDVYKIFRNDAFVFFDVDDPRPALDEIRRLENDQAEYLRRTDGSLPLLKATTGINDGKNEGDHSSNSTAATVDLYFSLLPNVGTGKLCREIHEMMGLPIPESLLPMANGSLSSRVSSCPPNKE